MKFTEQFDDVDALKDAVDDWDLDFLPLGRGKFEASISQYFFNELTLGFANFSSKIEQKGSTPKDCKTFVIPMNPEVNYVWRNEEIDKNTLALFPANRELYSISNESFNVCTISIKNDFLIRLIQKLELDFILPTLQNQLTWKIGDGEMQQLRYLAIKLSESYGYLDRSQIFSEDIVSRILLLLANEKGKNRYSQANNLQAIYHTSRWVSHTPSLDLNIKNLHRNSYMSRRAMEYAFRELFEMSPNNYLKKVKLWRTRKALKRSIEKPVIGKIARENGFNHLSQFSNDFKLEFGELPSIYWQNLKA